MRPQFEEKQFETAANLELAKGRDSIRVFSSGQKLEEILGYDVAADPDPNHMIWQLLDAPRPKGVVLVPDYWSAFPRSKSDRLPQSAVSLILQYKRADYLSTPSARQWNLWGSPYFRFEREEIQHRTLLQIERKVEGALIRYAAPAFWKYADLEVAQLQTKVLEQTAFVRPSDFKSHKLWTFKGPGKFGRGNPSGPRVATESIDDLFEIVEEAASSQTLAVEKDDRHQNHQLALAIGNRTRSLTHEINEWLNEVRDSVRTANWLSDDQQDALADYVVTQSFVRSIGAHWFLVGESSS